MRGKGRGIIVYTIIFNNIVSKFKSTLFSGNKANNCILSDCFGSKVRFC
jgi:hypothetical protein